MGDLYYSNTNISHSPMMSMTHLINRYFKLAQEIHIDERIVRPEAHNKWSTNIETPLRPCRRHQPQNSYSKSVLTYPKQFCLHTIEYYPIPQESHTQSILTIISILNHFKLLLARWLMWFNCKCTIVSSNIKDYRPTKTEIANKY